MRTLAVAEVDWVIPPPAPEMTPLMVISPEVVRIDRTAVVAIFSETVCRLELKLRISPPSVIAFPATVKALALEAKSIAVDPFAVTPVRSLSVVVFELPSKVKARLELLAGAVPVQLDPVDHKSSVVPVQPAAWPWAIPTNPKFNRAMTASVKKAKKMPDKRGRTMDPFQKMEILIER